MYIYIYIYVYITRERMTLSVKKHARRRIGCSDRPLRLAKRSVTDWATDSPTPLVSSKREPRMPEWRRGSPILRLVAPKAPIFASLSLQLSRYRPYTYFTPRHATRLLQLIKSNTPVPPLPSATIEPERAKKISAATITFHPPPFDVFDPTWESEGFLIGVFISSRSRKLRRSMWARIPNNRALLFFLHAWSFASKDLSPRREPTISTIRCSPSQRSE